MTPDMATNKQLALDCAVRIANTRLMKSDGDIDNLTDKVLRTAKIFEDYLGPDVQKSFGGPKQTKPTFDQPCPTCKGEMWDMRPSKTNPKAPDARCKNAGKWNAAENKFDGCQGVRWLEAAR